MHAIYARQSLDKKDSISIETQIQLCRRELEVPGEETPPVKVFIDRGYSGKDTQRPAFQAMMEAVKRGEIQKVQVYRLDRLSRSLLDFGSMMELFRSHQVVFSSTQERFDTDSAIGKAMLSIVMVFAQLERETIQQRVKDNYHARHARGAYDTRPPFGYEKCRVKRDGKAVSSLREKTEEAELLKKIFQAYAFSAVSLGSIARELNRRQIPSPAGALWDSSKLRRILANPLYVKADQRTFSYYQALQAQLTDPAEAFSGERGLVSYGNWDRRGRKFEQPETLKLSLGLHKGLIGEDCFLLCQEKLGEKAGTQNSGRGKYSFLTGILKCGYCKRAMKLNHPPGKRGNVKFICSGAANYGSCSAAPRLEQALLERLAEGEVLAFLWENRELPLFRTRPEEDGMRRNRLEIQKRQAKIRELLELAEAGAGPGGRHIRERIEMLDGEIRMLEAELEEKRRKDREREGDLGELHARWPKMSRELKRELCSLLFLRIEVKEDALLLYWKHPVKKWGNTAQKTNLG